MSLSYYYNQGGSYNFISIRITSFNNNVFLPNLVECFSLCRFWNEQAICTKKNEERKKNSNGKKRKKINAVCLQYKFSNIIIAIILPLSFFLLPACLPAFTSFHFIQQPNHSIAFSFCLILHTLCILLQMCHFPSVLLYSAASQLLCIL